MSGSRAFYPKAGTTSGTFAAGNHTHASTPYCDLVTAGGLFTPPRRLLTNHSVSTAGSGVLHVTHFVCARTEAVNTITMYTGGTAAGATPTLVKFGIWSVASNNAITLVASTANDTTTFANTHTIYAKTLTATANLTAGQLYAAGFLVVTAAAMPTLYGIQHPAVTNFQTINAVNPPSSGQLSTQTDLPTGVTPIGATTTFLFRLS